MQAAVAMHTTGEPEGFFALAGFEAVGTTNGQKLEPFPGVGAASS